MDHYSIVEPPSPDKDQVVPENGSQFPADNLSQPALGTLATSVPPPSTPIEAGSELPPAASAPSASSSSQDADLDLALQTLVQKAQYVSNANGAAIALRQGADAVCRAASGSTAPDRGARLQIKTGLTAECLRTGELMRCDNVMLDQRVDLESCKRLGIESIIITPIRCGQRILGVLELFSAHAYSFQDNDVETVKGLAEQIAKMLEQGGAGPAPAPDPVREALPVAAAEEALNTCGGCGAKIESDAVFCTACGSFQDGKPAPPVAEAAGWKSRLTSRRLLVPASFVAMALVVAVLPAPRRFAAEATSPQPALQAKAQSAPAASARPSSGKVAAPPAAAPGNPATASASAGAAANPTIAKSVKQLLGGVSSDFSKLLPVNEKAEPPSNGDPNLRVWVDTRKGYYYCPGEEQYGRTEHGSFMTQKQAESNYYIPALIKPCT